MKFQFNVMLLSLVLLTISGCSDDDDNIILDSPVNETVTENESGNDSSLLSFTVKLDNLTQSQPLSPFAFVVADSSYQAWNLGDAASVALEVLAEGGDNSQLTEAALEQGFIIDSMEAPIGSGQSNSIILDISENTPAYLTAVSMLVNTNDAFTGITAFNLMNLTIDESIRLYLPIYDAGTEANSELAGTIPGPADAGVGFDVARDDLDRVTRHPGIVSQDDGHSESVLKEYHRFLGNAAMITIERTQ
ncbi:MAG: spondin domain-containing protein [Pseudomonadota bacterium]